jgi:hypothetical protein
VTDAERVCLAVAQVLLRYDDERRSVALGKLGDEFLLVLFPTARS